VGTYDHNWHWYDATGQRMITLRTTGFNWAPDAITTGGTRTFYVYDGNDVALSIHRNGSGVFAVRARYLVVGVDNAIAGRFAGDFTAPKNLALINDRQGTTLAAMRGDGTQEDNVTYFTKDPFGGLIGATNQGGSMNTETGYAGASTPNASGGFIYLRNRWYDPKTGRFLTQDPIGLAGGVNLYSYAGNNPVMFTDPFGLCPDWATRSRGICLVVDLIYSLASPFHRARGEVPETPAEFPGAPASVRGTASEEVAAGVEQAGEQLVHKAAPRAAAGAIRGARAAPLVRRVMVGSRFIKVGSIVISLMIADPAKADAATCKIEKCLKGIEVRPAH